MVLTFRKRERLILSITSSTYNTLHGGVQDKERSIGRWVRSAEQGPGASGDKVLACPCISPCSPSMGAASPMPTQGTRLIQERSWPQFSKRKPFQG
jgi:hypothetical protein